MDPEKRQPLPPSAAELERQRFEARGNPDYRPPYPDPYPNPYDPVREQQRDARAATARRLEREERAATSGVVAGHDFKREAQEREERGRGR